MVVCGDAGDCAAARTCLDLGHVPVVVAALNCLQDVLGAMSPPPAPMFMPHGASLDTSSDELQSPLAVLGAREDVATPGAHRCARFPALSRGVWIARLTQCFQKQRKRK